MAKEVKLLGVTGSPFSCRVQIALKLKGVQYEFLEEEDVHGKKSDMLLKYNPVHKKIPVLLHIGKPIAESLVILEYIDETWKGDYNILPVDPYERATARFWAKFVNENCMPSMMKAFSSKGEEREKAIEEASELLKKLENELIRGGKKYFGGETIGLVDIAADFIGFWLEILQEVTGVELLTKGKFPKLSEWTDEFLRCTAVKETLPPRDLVHGFYQARFGK